MTKDDRVSFEEEHTASIAVTHLNTVSVLFFVKAEEAAEAFGALSRAMDTFKEFGNRDESPAITVTDMTGKATFAVRNLSGVRLLNTAQANAIDVREMKRRSLLERICSAAPDDAQSAKKPEVS